MADRAGLPVLAVDIGGTKILAAVFSGDGELLDSDRCPTQAEEGIVVAVERLAELAETLLARHGISGVGAAGIAAAGAIDTGRGLITVSPNLPGWRDVPLAAMLEERLGVPALLVNDASAAALGEHRYGAARGANDVVLLTLGTGIGGGIIIGGELYLGVSGAAAEIGHMVIDVNGPDCPCGSRGCLEQLASGTAIAREARRRLAAGEKSVLLEMSGGDTNAVTAALTAAAARKGDTLAGEVFARAATYLGIGLANLINIFNPDVIVLGGGMAAEADLIIEPARRVALEKAFPLPAGAVRIVAAELGNEAGVYGAAAYAFGCMRRQL